MGFPGVPDPHLKARLCPDKGDDIRAVGDLLCGRRWCGGGKELLPELCIQAGGPLESLGDAKGQSPFKGMVVFGEECVIGLLCVWSLGAA